MEENSYVGEIRVAFRSKTPTHRLLLSGFGHENALGLPVVSWYRYREMARKHTINISYLNL